MRTDAAPKNQLNLRKTSLPLSARGAFMESERSFVTVRRIDGVKIASRPSPRAHEERFRMTEQRHAGPFLPLSFLLCLLGATQKPRPDLITPAFSFIKG